LYFADIVRALALPGELRSGGTFLPSRAATPPAIRFSELMDALAMASNYAMDPSVPKCGMALHRFQRRLCGGEVRATNVAEGSGAVDWRDSASNRCPSLQTVDPVVAIIKA
jgi:hypothetical protein